MDSAGMAEGVGFEPTEACTSAVFKTTAFVHSATPPQLNLSAIPELAVDRVKTKCSRTSRSLSG